MIENVSREVIEKEISKHEFKHIWENTYSELKLVKFEHVNDFKFLEDLIEVKLFNEDLEMTIVKNDNGQYNYVLLEDKENNEYIEEKQILKYSEEKLVIRHYLAYDEEGQAYIKYTKLSKVEVGE